MRNGLAEGTRSTFIDFGGEKIAHDFGRGPWTFLISQTSERRAKSLVGRDTETETSELGESFQQQKLASLHFRK